MHWNLSTFFKREHLLAISPAHLQQSSKYPGRVSDVTLSLYPLEIPHYCDAFPRSRDADRLSLERGKPSLDSRTFFHLRLRQQISLPNPTMHLSSILQCTTLNGALWDMGQVHFGIYACGQFKYGQVQNEGCVVKYVLFPVLANSILVYVLKPWKHFKWKPMNLFPTWRKWYLESRS